MTEKVEVDDFCRDPLESRLRFRVVALGPDSYQLAHASGNVRPASLAEWEMYSMLLKNMGIPPLIAYGESKTCDSRGHRVGKNGELIYYAS
jgi:hypothetical protein